MKIQLTAAMFTLLLLLFGTICLYSQKLDMTFKEGQVQHVVKADAIKWMPCQTNLLGKCQMAVLEGNPKENSFFTVRFKMDEELVMPPHTHPKDERVTIIKGKAHVAFGKEATKADATEFTQGDYYVNAKNAIHSVWVETNTILQITGIGPWEADFVEE